MWSGNAVHGGTRLRIKYLFTGVDIKSQISYKACISIRLELIDLSM